MRGRGLKQQFYRVHQIPISVAPHAGAWIETYKQTSASSSCVSPPMRGRGLKLVTYKDHWGKVMSPPMRGRGLKLIDILPVYFAVCRPPCGGVD